MPKIGFFDREFKAKATRYEDKTDVYTQ